MPSKFKCRSCDSVYALRSDAIACCTRLKESFSICPHCNQEHDDEDQDDEYFCSHIEIHDIEDYRNIFAPLHQQTDTDGILSPEPQAEFIYQLAENTFKVVLPSPYIRATLVDAVYLIYATSLIQVNPTDLEINCNGQSFLRMKHCCSWLLTLFLAKPHWSIGLKDFGGQKRLREIFVNNGIDLDQDDDLSIQFIQNYRQLVLHFDIIHGEIFLTDNANRVLHKITQYQAVSHE